MRVLFRSRVDAGHADRFARGVARIMQALIEVARAEEETAVKNDSASQLRAETLRGHDRARFWLREVGHHARAVRGDQIAAVIARRIVEQTMKIGRAHV